MTPADEGSAAVKRDVYLEREQKFIRAYLKPLVGARITSVNAHIDRHGEFPTGDVWPIIRATLKDGTRVKLEISSDEEGNGSGFVFGLPHPGEVK